MVRDATSNKKGFRRTFYHIYTSSQWRIPILPPEDGPQFRLNQTVPEMSQEEAVVGIDLSTTPRTAARDLAYVPSNWLPTRYEMRNEMFLAAVGFSRSCNKGNFLIKYVWIYFNTKILTFSLFHLLPDTDLTQRWRKGLSTVLLWLPNSWSNSMQRPYRTPASEGMSYFLDKHLHWIPPCVNISLPFCL